MIPVFFIINKVLRRGILLGAAFVSQATAGFTSIYAFGDGVCTTTANPSPASSYYGGRYCNGRVWIEAVSQWQGVTYASANNLSYLGHDAGDLKTNAAAMTSPPDAATSLFIVWCANADFIEFTGAIPTPYGSMSPWTTRMNQSIADHVTAISTLYDKGARTIVMPNAVDVMRTPYFNFFNSGDKSFVRNRVIEYNTQFAAALANLEATKTGLVIYRPNVFTFLEQVLTTPASYGMTDPYPYNTGAFDSGDSNLNGTGAGYVFWDDYHPTARFQMHLAAFIQQIISPVKVNSISLSSGNVQLQVANIPLGRVGSILGTATLQPPWSQDLGISEPFVSGGSTTKSYTFPAAGAKRFYRAAFPVVWVWP